MKKNLFYHVFGTEFCGLVYLLLGKQTLLKIVIISVKALLWQKPPLKLAKEGEKGYWFV